jgi:hypothetical protein
MDVGPPRSTAAELVRQNFAQWKPGQNGANKASPGKLALDWVEQPDVEPEFVPVGEKWTAGNLVAALALSADGQFLIVGRINGQCRVWSLKTGQQIGMLQEKFSGLISLAAISPDGEFGALGCGAAGVVIWDTTTGKIDTQLSTGEPLAISFSTDSKLLSVIDKTRWTDIDVGTGGKARELALPWSVTFAVFSPSQRALVYSREGKKLRLLHREGKDSPLLSVDHGTLPVGPSAMVVGDRFVAFATEEFLRLQQLKTTAGDSHYTDLQPAIRTPNKLFLVANDEWLVGFNGSHQEEIWNTGELSRRFQTDSKIPRGNYMGWSADGRTIATASGMSGETLAVWRLKNWPERTRGRLAELVSESLRQENYDLLEDLVKQLADDPGCFPWATESSKTGYLLEMIVGWQTPGEDAAARTAAFANWRKQRPDSVAGTLAEVWRLILEAWAARGSGFASEVTPEGWEKFHFHLAQARELLLPLTEKKDIPLEAYSFLFEIAKGENWPEEQVTPFVDQLLARQPEYFDAHVERVEMLMPRWGGEVPDSEAYARRVADKVGGERGDMLYARLASGLQCYYKGSTIFEETQFDPERVYRGLALLGEQIPPDWAAANVGLFFAAAQKDHDRAQRFGMILIKDQSYGVWNPRCFRDQATYKRVLVWAVNPQAANAPNVAQPPVPTVGGKTGDGK